MKRVVLLLSLMIMTAFMGLISAAETRSSRIKWLTSYDEALQLSAKNSKPVILFFTGSDWCGWCIKLEEEALSTNDFADAAADKFIFVKLDFPMNRSQPSELTTQNKRLQKQFSVEGFPSLVLINSQQQKIGTAGYRPGGGKQYAQFLLKLVDDNSAYKQKTDNLEKQKLSSNELKQLFDQAISLEQPQDLEKIVNAGIKSDQKHFFLLEKYRLLANECKVHTKEATALKQQLLAGDPSNARQTYYQLALVDFESSCRQAKQNHHSADFTVAPLVDYIEKFGSKDQANLWRLQMIIAQVYYDNDQLPEALNYAEASLHSAPSTVRAEISLAIQNMHSMQFMNFGSGQTRLTVN